MSKLHGKTKSAQNSKRRPKPKRCGDEKEEQSTATSSKNRRKNKKKTLKAPPTPVKIQAPSHPKKDKNDMSIAEDEAPATEGTATSTVSTVSTVSSTGAADIPTQTPPKKDVVQSARKINRAEQPAPSSRKHAHTPTEKWIGESAAKGWMDKADFGKVKSDFEKILKTTVNVEKDCKKWKSNSKWNQSEDYPALDSNLVKVDNEYVNMSQLDVPLGRSVLLGQLPIKNSEESFWKAVFEKRATHIHVIIGTEPYDFFPQKADDYRNYGQMWVNNRHVDSLNDDVCRYLIEVLPHGCSNSIVCKLTVIKNWNIDTVHGKYAVVIKETLELTTFLSQSPPDENAMILSLHGAGRAGYFLALSVAINKFESKSEPCIADIVKKIRDQRPKAVENLTQYASLYISLFYFIKKKADALGKKSVELTQNFTNALIAEVTQPSLMGSAMTDVTGGGSTVMSLYTPK